MRRVELLVVFLIFATVNVSKWVFDITLGHTPFHVGYYVPFILVLIAIAAGQWLADPIALPGAFRVLLAWKALFIASALLTLPTVLSEGRLGLAAIGKAVGSELLNAAAVAAVLVIACRLSGRDRRIVPYLYLGAIGLAAAYTIAQAVAVYGVGLDLDAALTAYLPLWKGQPPSILDPTDSVWSGNGFLFRFTGLTGDPNLNAILFLAALPIMYLTLEERFRVSVAGLLVVSLGLIVFSASNTAVPLGILLVLALNAHHWRVARKTVVLVTLCTILISAYVLALERDTVAAVVTYKLNLEPNGSNVGHLRIAAETLALWASHPFGVGPNAFPVYSPEYSTHNSYLQALVEYGPVGLLALLGTIVALVRISLRTNTALGSAVAFATIVTAVAAMGHDIFRRMEFQFVLHTFAGLAVLEARDRRASGVAPATLVAAEGR